MLLPTGTFVSVNLPEVSVAALTRGEPVTPALHCSQATPGVKGWTP